MNRTLTLSTFTLVSALAATGPALGVDFEAGLITDLNANGLAFDISDVFGGGPYGFDDTAIDGTNDIVVYTSIAGNGGGGGISIPTSNGENNDGLPSNFEPADAAFAAIGNASGRLENGNVIRTSVWLRSDPADPITLEPQIEPVLKLEFWEVALSGNADFTGGIDNPSFGDRIFDTDQNGTANTIPNVAEQAQWADIDGNGTTSFGKPVSVTASTSEWRLFEHTYTVDDSTWGINDAGGFIPKDVSDVEEIRSVVFFGDFEGRNLENGGSMWFDNALVEIFANAGSVTANTNPMPVTGSAEIDGDYNDSGLVEQGDLDQVLANWGAGFASIPATWINQRPTEGIVDQAELDVVLQQWGSSAAPSFAGSTVPEPATLALLGLGGLAMLRRR